MPTSRKCATVHRCRTSVVCAREGNCLITWSKHRDSLWKSWLLQFWFLFLVPGLSTRPLTRWIESTKVQATLHPLSAVCACLPCVVVLPKCYLTNWLWISTAPLGYFGHLFASGTKNGSSQQTSNVKWSFYVFYLPTSYATSTKPAVKADIDAVTWYTHRATLIYFKPLPFDYGTTQDIID